MLPTKHAECLTKWDPRRCEKRIENMRKPGSERAAGHPLQNSLPSKQSLKRKNSWDLDKMPVSALRRDDSNHDLS